jgi:hypothetical protein
MWGRSLWREDGSVVYSCCWSSPAQSLLSPSPRGLVTIFYCLKFQTPPTWRDRSPYIYIPQGQGGTVIPPGTGSSSIVLLITPLHGLSIKYRFQPYLYFCMCISCRENVFTKPLSRNDSHFTLHNVEWYDDKWMMNWKGLGRKKLWSNRRVSQDFLRTAEENYKKTW